MTNNQIDLEAFGALQSAIARYKDVLEENMIILRNAADVCDQVMGSDPISQKKISRLETALSSMQAACSILEEAASETLRKQLQAEELIEEA